MWLGLGFVVSWKRLPFDFVRRSNDDMILCEIQLSHRMFIKTISSTQCLSFSRCRCHFTFECSLFSFFRFGLCVYFYFCFCLLHRAHAYLHRTILCFIEFRIPVLRTSRNVHCCCRWFVMLNTNTLSSIALMVMVLRVFDKPNDWWKWQYQTYKKLLFAPLWLLQCLIIFSIPWLPNLIQSSNVFRAFDWFSALNFISFNFGYCILHRERFMCSKMISILALIWVKSVPKFSKWRLSFETTFFKLIHLICIKWLIRMQQVCHGS